MKKMFPRWSMIFIIALLMTGCGQSGPLTLPKKATPLTLPTFQEPQSIPHKAN